MLIQVAATLRNFATKEYKQFLLEDAPAVSSTRFRATSAIMNTMSSFYHDDG